MESQIPVPSSVSDHQTSRPPDGAMNSGKELKSSEETPDHFLTASPADSGIDLISEDIVALSGRSSLNAMSLHQVSICEIFPRVILMSSNPLEDSPTPQFSLKGRPRQSLQQWYESMLNRGFHCLVFETSGPGTQLLSHCTELFRGQFLIFPKSPSSCTVDSLLDTAAAFSFWYLLDRRDSIAVFDLESLNPVSLAACLMVADLSKSPDEVCDKMCEMIGGLHWKPSERRYLQYMSKLIKTDSSTLRPRPIMIKQILIDSCFCSEQDLEILIADSTQTEALNKHVTQFYDDETQSIAVHFPQMKAFLFQGDVAVTIRSRTTSQSLVYRFNTGFIDNLTSSVINCGGSQWDCEGSVQTQFNVQIITVPATNTTSTPIVVPPYPCAGDRIKGRQSFASHHNLRPNDHLMEHFRSNKSGFSDLDVEISLKVTENNYLDSTMFLYKYFAADNPKNTEDMFLLCKLPSATSPALSRSPSIDDNGVIEDAKSFASGASRFSRRSAGGVYTRGASVRGDSSPSGSVRSVASRHSSIRAQVGAPKPLEPVRLAGQRSGTTSFRRYTFGRGAEVQSPEVKVPPSPDSASLPIIPESPVSVKAGALHVEAFSHANVESPPKAIDATPAGRPSVSQPDELITPSPGGEVLSRGGISKATPPPLPLTSPSSKRVMSPVVSPNSPPERSSPGARVASPGSRKSFMANLFGGIKSPLSRQSPQSPPTKPSGPMSPEPVISVAVPPVDQASPPAAPPRPSLGKAGPPGLPPQLGKASPPSLPGLASMSPPVPMRKVGGPPIPMGMPKAPPLPAILTESLEEPAELPLGRRLHWKALRNVEDTIWADMAGEEVDEDFRGLKSVFEDNEPKNPSAKQTSQSLPTTTRRTSIGVSDSKIITLLESKRAQNIGVVLARIRIELITLRLMHLETDSVSVEDLERLKTVLPTEEEVQCFNQYKGQVANLRDIEQKVFELFRMPRLGQRIKFCITFLNLPGQVEDILNEIMLMRKSAWEVRASNKLKKLLLYVLQMGNYVNGRKTKGFSIESLSKLMEFKSSSDPSITSLHFLAVKLMTSDPTLVDISDELPTLKAAARVAYDGVLAAVHTAKSEPLAFKHELANYSASYGPTTLEHMKSFVDAMSLTIAALTEEWEQCDKDLIELRKFFGEDPRKVSSDEFFNHLKAFLDNLSSTCADLKKKQKKFEKIVQAMQNQPVTVKPETPVAKTESKWSKIREASPGTSPTPVSKSWDTVFKALSPKASPRAHPEGTSPVHSPTETQPPKAIPVPIPKVHALRPVSERTSPVSPARAEVSPKNPQSPAKKWGPPPAGKVSWGAQRATSEAEAPRPLSPVPISKTAPVQAPVVPAVKAPPPVVPKSPVPAVVKPGSPKSPSASQFKLPALKAVSPKLDAKPPQSPPLVQSEVVKSPSLSPPSPRSQGWKMPPPDPKAKVFAPNWVTLPASPRSQPASPQLSARTPRTPKP